MARFYPRGSGGALRAWECGGAGRPGLAGLGGGGGGWGLGGLGPRECGREKSLKS